MSENNLSLVSRNFRRRIVPLLIWVLAVVAFAFAGQQQSSYQYAVGIVETSDVQIAPIKDGTIRSMRVDLFDSVEAGDIVAMMDDTLIAAELAIEEAQLNQLKAELYLERNRLESDMEFSTLDQLDELRRYQLDEEEARLEHVELRVDFESKQVKLERLKIQMDRQEMLVAEAIGSQSVYDDIRLRHKELKEELVTDQKALELAAKNIWEATRRRQERQKQSARPVQDTLVYLEPFLQQLKVQEAKRQEIQQESLTLVMRSPISGQVSQKFYGPGETILSGTPLISIQSKSAKRAIAYLDESSSVTITTGTEVQVRSVSRPNVVAKARVLRTGASMEELPPRIWSTPLIREWGRPVLIGDMPDGVFLPAETLNIRFK
jgi:multidrug resistance efflux pump